MDNIEFNDKVDTNKREIKIEDAMDNVKAGNGAICQMKEMPDGTKRYFNVYGMREQHKARMASVAYHHFNQYREQGFVNLFGEYEQFGKGEHSRDFVSVEDVVKVNLYLLDNIFFQHRKDSNL